MLIETLIKAAVPRLTAEELQRAVAVSQTAMRTIRDRYREPVVLHEVDCFQQYQILLNIKTVFSQAEEEFLYNYKTGELFAFRARYSHVDIMAGLR